MAHWQDPDPEITGLLSADRIQYYAEQLGMITPFSPENVAPASYELTLGPSFQYKGTTGCLTPEAPELLVPRNSIVFISFCEVIRLPHYIAARFDLTVQLLYHGIILGSGPQIDPGWHGALSTTLHNISNNERTLQLGQRVAKMEFIKTTPLATAAQAVLQSIHSEAQLYERAGELRGPGETNPSLFNRDHRWRRPILDYPPGDQPKISSSVAEIQAVAEGAREQVRRLRRFGLATLVLGTIGLLSVMTALIQVNMRYVDAQVTARAKQLNDPRVKRLQTDITRLAKRAHVRLP